MISQCKVIKSEQYQNLSEVLVRYDLISPGNRRDGLNILFDYLGPNLFEWHGPHILELILLSSTVISLNIFFYRILQGEPLHVGTSHWSSKGMALWLFPIQHQVNGEPTKCDGSSGTR